MRYWKNKKTQTGLNNQNPIIYRGTNNLNVIYVCHSLKYSLKNLSSTYSQYERTTRETSPFKISVN